MVDHLHDYSLFYLFNELSSTSIEPENLSVPNGSILIDFCIKKLKLIINTNL